MPTMKLVIEVTADGQVKVDGPIGDKILYYGLLECARDACVEFHRQNEKRVQPVTLMPVPAGRG